MSCKIVCFKRSFLAGVALLFAATVAQAANGTWNGTADALWTNSVNWSATPYPSGGDTATFNNAGGVSTALDIAGLSGILNITFDTASVAAYTIGAGAANSQTNILRDAGEIKLTSSAGNSQSFNAMVRLGPDNANAAYSLRNDNASQTLTFNSITGMSGGNKTLNINGTGPITFLGNLNRAASGLFLNLNATGPLTLSGANNQLNQLNIYGAGAVLNLATGSTTTFNGGGGFNLVSDKNAVINGPGTISLSTGGGENYADNACTNGCTLTINAKLTAAAGTGFEYWHGSYTGTVALLGNNDFTGNIIFNMPGTVSCTNIMNQGVSGNLGKGTSIIWGTGNNGRLLYSGTGETTDRIIELRTAGIIDMSGTGNLKFTSSAAVKATTTLTLQGSTAGTGEFSAPLTNNLSLLKQGTGTWILSANNTYSGATAVNGGTLALTGASGATTASSGYSLTNSATLRLYNISSANNTNRLRDASAIAMSGGTLNLANDASPANYLENAGTLSVLAGGNTVAVDQAQAGQTSTLRFASLTRVAGATINFTGTGIGENDQNRIFITAQPAGLIGPWATINGTSLAAYDSVKGVYAANTAPVSDIAARGPDSVITNDATAIARINLPGDTGPITLAGDFTNSILQVLQNTTTNAVVALRNGANTNKTLLASGLAINAGMASLTLGEASGDGFLAPLAAGGSIALQNNEPTSALTVNAPVVNNTTASSLAKYGPGTVMLTASNSYSGITFIDEGVLSFSGSVTQTLAGAINGNGSLVKQGSGQLTLAGGGSYAGLTTIKEGIVVAQNNAAFGSVAAGTVLEAGATLDVGGALNADNLNLGTELFTVSGTGVGGKGAVVNNSPRQQSNAFGKLALAGDATFGGVSRWDLRQNAPALTLNGYNLTKVGGNTVALIATTVTPGAGSIDVASGAFQIETSTKLNGSETNTMRIRTGATMGYYLLDSAANATPWSLVLDDRSTVATYSGLPPQNTWTGPVTLNGLVYLGGNAGCTLTFPNPLTNAVGSIVKIGAGSTAYLTSSNNTYSGGTIVSNGTLYVTKPGGLPGYDTGAVTVAGSIVATAFGGGGILAVAAGNGITGWSNEQIQSLHNSAIFTAADASLGIDTVGANLAYPNTFPVPMGLVKMGTGTLTIPAGQSLRGQLRVNGGELILNNIVNNSTNRDCYIGEMATDSGRLILSGTTALGSYLPGRDSGNWQAMVVGMAGKGVLVLNDSSSVTNKLIVGNSAGSAGAIYQSGTSKMHNWGGGQSDGRIGLSGYGYYELNGGTFTNNGYFHLGRDLQSIGILRQTGGAFEQGTVFGGQLGLSRGGTGVVYTAGGTFVTATGINVGESSDNGTTRGYAEFTVDGSAEVNINGNVSMADRTFMFAALNLNDGRLTANQISKVNNRASALALVNFDGGTFRARTGGNLFNVGVNAPDAVRLYAGGAIFDTTNLDVSVSVPLLAPTGSGVSGISVTPRGGYIGPPFVTIAGGGGTGATAIAQFDSASGFVNGITVTCPGYGYTGVPSVTLSGGGTNIHPSATASIGSNTSGGLTKLGSSLLLLNATNTYAGATSISNGTLRLNIAAALPANSAINMSGGVLDLGGFSITSGTVNVSGGSIINGSLNGSSVTKVQNGTLTLGTQLTTPAPIIIGGGTMRLQGLLPGLNEAPVTGAFNVTDPMTTNIVVRLTTRMANIQYYEPYQTTWIYSGYLWNRAATNVTWTFAENFDDSVLLKIDGTTVLNNGAWNVPTYANFTLTPGAHAIEARFGQGGGGGGPPAITTWWKTTSLGFGVDVQGRNDTNILNYAALTDPGDGSLLTLTASSSASNMLATASTVELAAGATLDLGGMSQTLANLRGSGTVTNGTLAISGTIAPGGTNVIGTLTIATSSVLTGTLLVDVATDGTSDRLVVQGSANLSALNLVVANPGQLAQSKQYTLVTGTPTGTFASLTGPDSRWKVIYYGDGTVKLVYNNGTMIQFH